MGLFGFGKKKETVPTPFIDEFVVQRIKAAEPLKDLYAAILWQPEKKFFEYNKWYYPGGKEFPVKMMNNFLVDGRDFVKKLKSWCPDLDESGMDPIPKKTFTDSVFIDELIKKTAERGYAPAAAFNYLYSVYKSWRWDKPEYKTDAENLLRYSCGDLGEKYADILDRLKKGMMYQEELHISQEEAYLTTVSYVMNSDKSDRLSDIKWEHHREICEYMREVLTDLERSYLYVAAGTVEFLMAIDKFACPYSTCKLAYCLAHSASTHNKNYMMEEYDLDPSYITEEEMGKAANQIIEGLRQKAREGDSYAAESLKAWGF